MPVTTAALGVQAFYILFANQIDSPDWPTKVCQNGGHGPQGSECVDATAYRDGVLITSPQNMTTAHIAKIKRDVPGAKVVGYWDFGGMPLYANHDVCPFCTGHVMGDKPGRNCSTTYPCGRGTFTDALNATVPHELLVRRRTGKDKRWMLVEGYPGLAAYCWNSKLAPLLATFLGEWLSKHGFDGIYLDGYVEADRVHMATTAPKCNVVDVGEYTGPLLHLDAPDNATNVAGLIGGKCGFGQAPCNITDLKRTCDSTDGCGGFNSNGWLKAGPLTKEMLVQTPTAVKENSSFWLRKGSAVTCEWDYDGDGEPDTPLEHAGMYWAWRSAFVAQMRKILGNDAIILANSAGAVSDPSLSGITIEMESCVGGSPALQHCSDALEGQRFATEATGLTPLSVLWMTHSEAMSPATQCENVGKLQAKYSWVQAGTDFFDGSHITCSNTSSF